MHRRDDRPRTTVPPLPAFLDPPELPEDDLDGESSVRLSDEALAALLPDDDYEPVPDALDFWIDADN